MKHYCKVFTFTFLLALCTQLSFSQETVNRWSFETGLSTVDLYPVGENTPQGEYFDEFFNLNDHYNFGYYIGATRNITNNLSISAKGTINEISKWGDLGTVDESVLVDNLKYYGLDGMINYSFGKGKLQPFIAVGGGYTWIEEGLFNTFSTTEGSNNLVGAGTVNGSVGLKYWISDKFGINLQTTYKHAFKDYLSKHWDHNLGIVYKLGTEKQSGTEPKEVSTGNSRWSFEAGLSAVDVYPVGENTPQGEYFDEFFNLNDHWNLGYYVGVTRTLTNNLSITAKGTVNELSKWGDLGQADESVLVDNLKYYGLDGMVNYSFGKGKLRPFVGVGGGYTWIEEGPYNTFSTKEGTNNLVGAGTANGSVGVKYWFNDKVGLNVQTTYKHSFEDYLPKHFDHNVGLVYKIGNGKEKEEEESNDRDGDTVPNEFDLCPDTFGLVSLGGCPDSDGDGVADKDDLCPEVKGSIEFGGCADTDGDGVADNKDNCPKVKGTDNGCPAKVVEPTVVKAVTPVIGETKVYFDYNSATLDENAKVILNNISTSLTKDTDYTITIEGHADSRGGENYNYNLSLERAQAIKNYLSAKNLGNSSISISAKGKTEPAATNATESGRTLNRRAELTINISAK